MYREISPVINQVLKYCISGGIGVIIDFLIFSVLVTSLQVQYLISNLISFSLGTLIVCYLQKNWTFQYDTEKKFELYSRYLLSIGFVFVINNILLIMGVEIIHLTELNAKIFQLIFGTFIGYVIQKRFVFLIHK